MKENFIDWKPKSQTNQAFLVAAIPTAARIPYPSGEMP